MNKRSHFSQLPSVEETEEILKKEAKRAVPEGKRDKHYTDFSPVIMWLEELEMEADIFKKNACGRK